MLKQHGWSNLVLSPRLLCVAGSRAGNEVPAYKWPARLCVSALKRQCDRPHFDSQPNKRKVNVVKIVMLPNIRLKDCARNLPATFAQFIVQVVEKKPGRVS